MEQLAFKNLIESSDTFKRLKGNIMQKCIKQSYLFVSRDKVIIRLLANLFVAHALFEENGGQLLDYVDAVFEALHADVSFLGRNEKGVVNVNEIDELQDVAQFRPSRGNKRFFVIDNGETMNAACQNKLLKTLEDPPSTAFFVVLTSNINTILPTIVSRCERVEPPALSVDEILSGLKESYPNNQGLELAAAASGGSIDTALSLIDKRKGLFMFNMIFDALEALHNSKGVLNASYKFTGIKESINDFVDFLELIFRDLMMLSEQKEELCQLKMFLPRLRVLEKRFSIDALCNIMPLFLKARNRLKFYGNINSVADELFFSIAQIKAGK